MACSVKTEILYGLETVTLENDLVQAVVLVGKGADLFQYIWKPLGINCLYRSKTPRETFLNLDLSKERLQWAGDRSLGGWMDSLPHRGFYKDIELTQQTGGIAPTVPWTGKTVQEQGKAAVYCKVALPVIPLEIEKTYTLTEGSAILDIQEKLYFKGDAPVSFTWTQHALFGGDFVDEHTIIDVPTNRVFDAWAQMRNLAEAPNTFVYPIDRIPLRGTKVSLRHPLPPDYNGSEFVVFMDLIQGTAALSNPKLGLTVRLHYDLTRFPYLRSLYQSDADGIIIGLEPGNDRFSGFAHSYKYGTYTTMYPGDTLDTWFKLEYALESAQQL